MFERIKSIYFTKILFSYLYEGNKLDIVKHNKRLQKIININNINYLLFSGRYIVYEKEGKVNEKEGKVKEYNIDNDILIFEGDYLNGKRHGKGKLYYPDGNKLFEGEFLNGKKNGKGKEFYVNGNLLFEGVYLNGNKWNGIGYELNTNNILFELKNGKGKVKEYIFSFGILVFEGEYLYGERNGKGKIYDYNSNKILFEGEYLYGNKWKGKGYDLNNNLVYELKNGKGFVKEYDHHGGNLIREGKYKNGKLNGKGKVYLYDKIIYDGEFINGLVEGKGKQYNSNGNLMFEGEFLYNYKIRGKEYVNRKLEYEGEFRFYIKWNGKGYDENGNVIYELINGNGKVKEYYLEKLIFEGEYLNGKRNGKAKQFWKNGNLQFEGEYLNGEKNGKGKDYDQNGNLIYEGEYINGNRQNNK